MPKKIVIVGGVAGGASFAARLRRLDESAKIILFERGPHISFANCGLPYHISGIIPKKKKLLLQTPDSFNNRYNVDVRIHSEVTSVNPNQKTVTVRTDDQQYKESFDVLLLSPGCAPMRPSIPGFEHPRVFTLRNIPDMQAIKTCASQDNVKKAVVIGGGFIGLEMVENLKHLGLDVSLVEMTPQVFLSTDIEMANILHMHLKEKGVHLYLDNVVKSAGSNGTGLTLSLNKGDVLDADIVIMAIGVKPDTGFLDGSDISLNQKGAICVDKHMQTNIPDIYAVGDAVEITDLNTGHKAMVPLAGPANRQGRIAADNVAGLSSSYKNTQGTAICQVFDYSAAVTGLNEKTALKYKIPYVKSYTHSANHAGYYPDAQQMHIKTLFQPNTGKVLGATIIGKNGVDKRIDIFATAVRHGLTMVDLTELELAYAPPYSSAKDPVNIAGYVGENILHNRMAVVHVSELNSFNPDTQILLDVRSPKEIKKSGGIPGHINIPVDELRTRFSELNNSKEIIIYCMIGQRAWIAHQILSQNGFKAGNLSGGWLTYMHYHSN